MEKCLKLDDNALEYISAGREVVSSDYRFRNAANFYLNLVPGFHRKHYKLVSDVPEWPDECAGKRERNIKQTLEETNMSWKVLSKSEKLGVCFPGIFTGCMAAGVGVCSLARWIKTKI